MTIKIRPYQSEDLAKIIALFKAAVRTINSRDYNSEQIAAWALEEPDLKDWEKSLAEHMTYVAVQGKKIVGFADMSNIGYLDRLYVHPDFKGKFIAKRLFLTLYEEAKNRDLERITADVSITAMPYAQHFGFKVVEEREIECRGQIFKVFYMELELNN